MKIIISSFLLLLFIPIFSQNKKEFQEEQIQEKNSVYHQERIKNSVPPHNLSKIKNRVSKLEKTAVSNNYEEGSITDYYIALEDKEFDKLTEKEKFTYVMIHLKNCFRYLKR